MYINYKAQFSNQPAARGRKKAAARNVPADADSDVEILDDDSGDSDEVEGQSGSASGHRHNNEARGVAEGSGGARTGRWVHQNRHNVRHHACCICIVCHGCVPSLPLGQSWLTT